MKGPKWFWTAMLLWLLIGVSALWVGAAYRGYFSPLPDPPPYFQSPYEDQSLWANATWLLAVLVVYAPLILILLMLLQRHLARRKSA
jgi:hypothetical protein